MHLSRWRAGIAALFSSTKPGTYSHTERSISSGHCDQPAESRSLCCFVHRRGRLDSAVRRDLNSAASDRPQRSQGRGASGRPLELRRQPDQGTPDRRPRPQSNAIQLSPLSAGGSIEGLVTIKRLRSAHPGTRCATGLRRWIARFWTCGRTQSDPWKPFSRPSTGRLPGRSACQLGAPRRGSVAGPRLCDARIRDIGVSQHFGPSAARLQSLI